jgi:hypothetical protein
MGQTVRYTTVTGTTGGFSVPRRLYWNPCSLQGIAVLLGPVSVRQAEASCSPAFNALKFPPHPTRTFPIFGFLGA